MPVDYTTTRAFDDAEKLALTRAWVAVVGITECKLRTNYSLNAQDRAAEELLAQWQTLKYFQSRQTLRSDLACVGLSYKWAAAEYNAKTGKAFREVNAASLLTNYHKWWTVLNPLVNLQQDAIVEGGLTIATEQPHHALPQAARELCTYGVRRWKPGARSSGEQRLNVESPILQGPKAEILLSPLGSTSSELSPSSAQSPLQKPSLLLSEHLEMRKVVVMERRLDLEIMTQSQEGLSDDAVEYPRWQRRLVLAKMRQQARGNNKDQV
ncbi:hypothetical protein GQ600_26267 [Phytophthora cactorum]|nr:hypothetical protein GQ600_26267 [Phytophthora cactorum]